MAVSLLAGGFRVWAEVVGLLVFLYIEFVYCVADWIAWFVVATCGFGCFELVGLLVRVVGLF